jgi:hypothetical protein
MRSSDAVRYALWGAVAVTAARNRKEYGVPTAWLTHLAANSLTMFLPELLHFTHERLERPGSHPIVGAALRTLDRRVRQDPNYAGYVAPLAIGFIASHADYSIYHGRWAERTVMGFGADSVPHASAAYGLARLVSETMLTFADELPANTALASSVAWGAEHVDLLAGTAVGVVTLIWELSEYKAHIAELNATGRDASEINMQWSLPDAITDSLCNLGGLLAAIAVRRRSAPGRT